MPKTRRRAIETLTVTYTSPIRGNQIELSSSIMKLFEEEFEELDIITVDISSGLPKGD